MRRRHRIIFEAFGVTAEISTNHATLLQAVEDVALPPTWAPGDPSKVDIRFTLNQGPGDLCDLLRDGDPIAQAADLEMSLSILDSSLRSKIAVSAVGRVFVHAGVVRVGDRAMILPGESFSGKTTLVAALVRGGATYMSDEFAVFGDDGMVHPYARDLSIRVDGAESARTVETGPHLLGKVETERPARVGLIVVSRYRPEVSWRPQRRSRGEGALALVAHAAAARERPREVLATVRRAAVGAEVLEGDRGDATDTAKALIELFQHRADSSEGASAPSAPAEGASLDGYSEEPG